jgi:PBP1b-binding outer membrane lipoprotein LpoB
VNSNLGEIYMKKKLIITLSLVLLVAVLSGCAKTAVQPENVIPEPTKAAEPTAAPSPEPSAKIAENGVDMQGKLNGWIDSNSVEIEINSEDILAFRVTDVLDQMNGIEDGATVKFSYDANENGQLIITKIEKVQ